MDRAGAGDVSEEYFKSIKMMAAAQAGKEEKKGSTSFWSVNVFVQ